MSFNDTLSIAKNQGVVKWLLEDSKRLACQLVARFFAPIPPAVNHARGGPVHRAALLETKE